MSRRRDPALLAFDALTIEGGLLPAEWLGKIAKLKAPHQSTADYGIPKGLNLRDELGRYWRIAEAQWHDFDRVRTDSNELHAITRRFVITLLREVFGFTDLTPASTPQVIGERHYPLTAQALGGRLPVVVAAESLRLEDRDTAFGDDGRQRSAFGLLQDYLNAAEPALWGLVSNGSTLRLARDNASFTRPAWIEADLERIFREERFADFSALWLLIHASRFGRPDQPPQQCAQETWRNHSREEGTRAREKLRQAVHDALLDLGQGFLTTPGNKTLHEKLGTTLTPMDYFQQLLRLVYRLIFLLTIEERGLLHPEDGDPQAIELYRKGYSLHHLRERSRRRRAFDRHHDVWQGLKPVFTGLAHGQPLLALPALGGLFADDQCADLDTAALGNSALLAAIYRLTWMHDDGALVRINWRDMGPEEFGSVYESLLELVPDISADGRRFRFADPEQAKGNKRRTTGSYYTPDPLVQELLDSALQPVIEQRLAAANDQEQALLAITVCDPACGSGHFLLAAARRMANQLARLRAQGTPSGDDFRHALRDVISHCIYGVDVNPMALELARMSLWLEAMTPDKPLGFLDHHLQCGDALLGVLDPAIIDHGLPDDAFAALTGDDKAIAGAAKKRNKLERASWQQALSSGDLFQRDQLAARTDAVEKLADDDLDAVAAKDAAWHQARDQAQQSRLARLANLYVGAFLLPKLEEHANHLPSSRHLWAVANNEIEPSLTETEAAASHACADANVLHWWAAFPQIAEQGGFGVMLGNPPWERIKLQEQEFFASRNPLIALAINKAERERRIKLLREGRLQQNLDGETSSGLLPNENELRLYDAFAWTKRTTEAASVFAHVDSGRYPLTGVGDVNTYALFAESFSQLTVTSGRVGIIVPTGIATDDSTKCFISQLTSNNALAAIYSFENEEFVFPAIHHAMKFCLMISGGDHDSADFVYFARQVSSLADTRRHFTLTPDEFALINPNTRTCPVFRSQRDAELTKKLYRQTPVLIREAIKDDAGDIIEPEVNPWGIHFQRMLDMSTDSSLFLTAPDQSGEATLPLYEGKMIHQFDHRWCTWVAVPEKKDGVDTVDVTDAQKADPGFIVTPRYWVEEREVLAKIARVPRPVTKTWLARHHAKDDSERAEADNALGLALAEWVAGELFRREAGIPQTADHYDSRQKIKAIPRVEQHLSDDYPAFAHALKEAGITGCKAHKEFPEWALRDRETALSDDELTTLWHFTNQPISSTEQDELLAELDRWMDRRSPRWLMGWRDITNATNERTVIASVIPRTGVGHTMPLLLSDQSPRRHAALLGNMNSLALDYIARQKVGGTHLTYNYIKQFPVLPPDHYTDADLDFIVPRILELTYTTHDLADWASELGCTDAPFPWDPNRRARLRAELDTYYAHLYGLDEEELRYTLDPAEVEGEDYPSETFRALKNREIRDYGKYRTRQLVFEAWKALQNGTLVAHNALSKAPPKTTAEPHRRQRPSEKYVPTAVPCCEAEDWLAGLACDVLLETGDVSESTLRSMLAVEPPANTAHLNALRMWTTNERQERVPLVVSWFRKLFGLPASSDLFVPEDADLSPLLGDNRTRELAATLVATYKAQQIELEANIEATESLPSTDDATDELRRRGKQA